MTRSPHIGAFAAALLGLATCGFNAMAAETHTTSVARGRYLVQTSGCNDCHTAGYMASAGQVAEKDWLTGDALGWHGPWGTTYATNLRLQFARLSETQWLGLARTMQPRPPMPWFNLRVMTDADLRAIYRYIRSAGPAGQPAPAALAPGVTPPMPFAKFP